MTAPAPTRSPAVIDRRYSLKLTAGLALAGLLLFGASFNDPFHFDDTLITNDSNVTTPGRWPHFLNPLHLRQVTFFSFYLNHLAVGISPAGFHVVNVLLHIANAVLLFLLLRGFVERWIAAAAAVLFLVHPVQTEAVLYIYQRSILLACFFSLLALIALREGRPWIALLFFFLAFESKESALAIPLAVALLTPNQWKDLNPRLHSLRLFGVGAALLAGAALGLLAYWRESTVGLTADIAPVRYLLVQTRVLYTYLRLLVFPYPQSLEYEFPEPGGVLAILGIAGMLAAGWWFRRSIAGVCILAFFILLAPTSSIIPSADAAFEHRLYLPMLAFALFAAYVISRIPQRTWLAGVLAAILSVLTVQRGTVWSSDIALWEDTVKHAPGKPRVWFNLGGAYMSTDPEKARAALLRALELEPHLPQAYYDLGIIEQGRNNWNAALTYYGRAIEQDPTFWQAWNNMGNTLFSMGNRERSIEYFTKTLSLNPDYWAAQYNIAIVHIMSGRYAEAEPRLRTVLDWQPDFREARQLLALTLTRAGNRASADAELKKLGETHAAESRNTPTMILAPNRP
jgi:tetratricopeptide (TPR) repeat protein